MTSHHPSVVFSSSPLPLRGRHRCCTRPPHPRRRVVMEAVGLNCRSLAGPGRAGESLRVDAEVVCFSGERLFLMPTSEPVGLRPGALVVPHEAVAPRPPRQP